MKTDEATVSGKWRSASVASATVFNHITADSVPHRPYVESFKVEFSRFWKVCLESAFFQWFCRLRERNSPEWLWTDFSVNNSACTSSSALHLSCLTTSLRSYKFLWLLSFHLSKCHAARLFYKLIVLFSNSVKIADRLHLEILWATLLRCAVNDCVKITFQNVLWPVIRVSR